MCDSNGGQAFHGGLENHSVCAFKSSTCTLDHNNVQIDSMVRASGAQQLHQVLPSGELLKSSLGQRPLPVVLPNEGAKASPQSPVGPSFRFGISTSEWRSNSNQPQASIRMSSSSTSSSQRFGSPMVNPSSDVSIMFGNNHGDKQQVFAFQMKSPRTPQSIGRPFARVGSPLASDLQKRALGTLNDSIPGKNAMTQCSADGAQDVGTPKRDTAETQPSTKYSDDYSEA
jgi:hypothetical protein